MFDDVMKIKNQRLISTQMIGNSKNDLLFLITYLIGFSPATE